VGWPCFKSNSQVCFLLRVCLQLKIEFGCECNQSQIMNSDLIPHFERIERELAVLMLANKRALEDAAERDRIRIGESEARESARAEGAVERRGLRSFEGARDRMKLRMEWTEVADAASRLGVAVPASGLALPLGGGLSDRGVRRMAYLCGRVRTANEREWRGLLEWALDDRDDGRLTWAQRERKAAVLELAAYLQVSAFGVGDIFKLVEPRMVERARLAAVVVNGGDLGVYVDSMLYLGLSAVELAADALLDCRDSGYAKGVMMPKRLVGRVEGLSEGAFLGELDGVRKMHGGDLVYASQVERLHRGWKADGRSWGDFNLHLDEARRRRMENGRGCLLVGEVEAVVRAEVAKLRQLALAAEVSVAAAELLESSVQGSEVVVGGVSALGRSAVGVDSSVRASLEGVLDMGVDEVRAMDDRSQELVDRRRDQERVFLPVQK
jgi:hypothetical protein